jgi:hypothetical protein
MGVDWYSCRNCGDTFPDCGPHESCECGEHWCCSSCAEEDGINYKYDEEDDYETISCNYCREEDFEDYELLYFLFEKHNTSRQKVIEQYKQWKEDDNE